MELEMICGRGLAFTLDGFRLLYLGIAILMWIQTGLFSLEYFKGHGNKGRYALFTVLTFLGVAGVFLSADLYTTFIFFEIMSFTSYVWVAQEETKEALRAAETYLAVAVIGGLVMLLGIFLLYNVAGTLRMSELYDAVSAVKDEKLVELSVVAGCLVFGFGAKAGMFPLHIWLPKAHPVAPAPASALLSGMLTKTGIFGILVVSSEIFRHDKNFGFVMLMLGVVTMFGGALLALFSIDMKRTLACSSMSQIGFILVGVGMQGLLGEENALAVRGTILHMVNHSLIKLVLFLAAGTVYMNLHKLNLNEIRGFGKKKPLFQFAFLMGALGIGGIPLWNGYVSKTLLHESIVEWILELQAHGSAYVGLFRTVEWIFLISGGLTIAYMLKLYVALFVEEGGEKSRGKTPYMNGLSTFALAGSAVILPVLGTVTGLMDKIASFAAPFLHGEEPAHAVAYFSFVNLKGALISLAIGVLVYVFVVRKLLMVADEQGNLVYVDRWPSWLDLENLIYRPVLLKLLPAVFGTICMILDRYVVSTFVKVFVGISSVVCRCLDNLTDGILVLFRKTTHRTLREKRTWPINIRFAHGVGILLDDLIIFLNKNIWRKHPVEKRFSMRLIQWEEEALRTSHIIGSSLSFGLLLVGVGLCLTLIYLLWW